MCLKATCWRCGQKTEKDIKHEKRGWTCSGCYEVETLQFHEGFCYTMLNGKKGKS